MMKHTRSLFLLLTFLFVLAIPISVRAEDTGSTEPSISEESQPNPLTFDAKIIISGQGYVVKGTLAGDLPADLIQVMAYYSLDGNFYEPIVHPNGEGVFWDMDQFSEAPPWTRITMWSNSPPLDGYVNGTISDFYIKLVLTSENDTETHTPAVFFTRNAEPVPLPEGVTATMGISSGMRVMHPFHGRYTITVREGTTQEELYALLPDTLPMEIHLSGENFFENLVVERPAQWQLPEDLSLTVQEDAIVIPDAAKVSPLPDGSVINLVSGNMLLGESPPLIPNSQINLVVQVLPKEEPIKVSLDDELRGDYLSLIIETKPTGATALDLYYFEGEKWVKIGNLLDQVPVDTVPKSKGYGVPDLLHISESPYREYLNGEIDGFQLGLEVIGGVFHEEKIILPFPGDYEFSGTIPGFGTGSGGNENNAGNGNGNDGQRPDIPGITLPPAGGGSTDPDTSSPEPPSQEPEEPSSESGADDTELDDPTVSEPATPVSEPIPPESTSKPTASEPTVPKPTTSKPAPSEPTSIESIGTEPSTSDDSGTAPSSGTKNHPDSLPPKAIVETSSTLTSNTTTSSQSTASSHSTTPESTETAEAIAEPTPARAQSPNASTGVFVTLLSVGVVGTVGVGVAASSGAVGSNLFLHNFVEVLRKLFIRK